MICDLGKRRAANGHKHIKERKTSFEEVIKFGLRSSVFGLLYRIITGFTRAKGEKTEILGAFIFTAVTITISHPPFSLFLVPAYHNICQ
jgi:NhaP-type Na+/H+ or K+/H+ antiporter